jgi:hypothetical protein
LLALEKMATTDEKAGVWLDKPFYRAPWPPSPASSHLREEESQVGRRDNRTPSRRSSPGARQIIRFEYEDHFVLLQRQAGRDLALFLPGEGIIKVVMIGRSIPLRPITQAVVDRQIQIIQNGRGGVTSLSGVYTHDSHNQYYGT